MSNLKTNVEVHVIIRICLPACWGPGFTLSEITKQAKESALRDIQHVISSNSPLNEETLSNIRKRILVNANSAKIKITIEEP